MCGGKSSRMGFDKALLYLNDEYVLMSLAKKLTKIFTDVIFVTNYVDKFPKKFSQFLIIEDEYPRTGPLGGLITALEYVVTTRVFLIACDMPNISLELILNMSLYKSEVVICEQDSRLHPLFAFYHKRCIPILKKQLMTNDLRMVKSFNQFSVEIVKVNQPVHFININKPEQLELWKKLT